MEEINKKKYIISNLKGHFFLIEINNEEKYSCFVLDEAYFLYTMYYYMVIILNCEIMLLINSIL